MADEIVKKIQDMLNEEKWTRATIPDYSTKNFDELDALLDQIEAAGCGGEVKTICDEHLAVTKDSIIALYLSGILSLKKRQLDDSALIRLVNIFADKPNKGAIVEYLCKRIRREYPESKFALRTLVDYYGGAKEKNNEEAFQIWKDLVQVDSEEAELAKHIAEKYERDYLADGRDSDRVNAVEYYTKALNRYIAKRQEENVDLIWTKLLELRPDDIDFFYRMERKIAKNINKEKAEKLLVRLYEQYRRRADEAEKEIEERRQADGDAAGEKKNGGDKKNVYWDYAIEILKRVLAYDENDSLARTRIVECYKGKYAGHSQLQKCINSSDLARNYRNVFEAIADFEKRIAFDKGNYVYHRAWGVGEIEAVDNNDVTICFYSPDKSVRGKQTKKMTLDMAVTSLQVLSKKHIWVIKAKCSAKSIADKIKGVQKKDDGKKTPAKEREAAGTKWILKTVIQSFGNNCDMKRIKEELSPSILTPAEWTSWSVKARKMLNSDSTFAVNPSNMEMYQVRENLSLEEKLYNEFKAQKDFFARLKIIDAYVFPGEYSSDGEALDLSSDYFSEMFDYFAGYLNSPASVNEQTIASYLELEKIAANPETRNYDFLQKANFKTQFIELFDRVSDPCALYTAIKNPDIRKIYLSKIHALVPNWADIYAELFPVVLSSEIITPLVKEGQVKKVQAIAEKSFENYRDYREAVIWFFKNSQDEPWFKELGISYEKILITLIHIIDITYREIENHCNTTENRKINKQAQTLLFTNKALENYMLDKDPDVITRLYTLISDVKDLDPVIKMNIRARILEKYPDFKFYSASEEQAVAVPRGLIVTAKKLAEKKLELEKIMADIAANTKDISAARELGDLKENAEYKAAKEKEAQLNTSASKLRNEIDRAQLFDPSTVSTAYISFGTTARLKNETTGEEEEYTIAGPWESNPERNVLSYRASKGGALWNHKKGDQFTYTDNNGNETSYTVLEIRAAAL